MPAWIGPLLGFALGAFFAWFYQEDVERDDPTDCRARLTLVAIFSALVFAPICAYFLIFAGDWAYAYFADTRLLPSALTLVLVVVDLAIVPGGFVAGYGAARRRADRLLLGLVGAPLAFAVVTLVALHRRLSVDATYYQVASHFGTRPVGGSPLGYALLWMCAMLVAGVVITLRALPSCVRPPMGAAPRAPSVSSQEGPLLGARSRSPRLPKA